MPRGRPRKPTAVKILEGNPGQHALPEFEPQMDAAPDCPEPMPGLSAEAGERWNQVAPELYRSGVLRVIDDGILAQYCEAYAGWRRALREIEDLGPIVEQTNMRDHTNLVRSPWCLERDACADRMHRFGAELGMTPASRAKVVVLPRKEKNSEKENFNFGGAQVAGRIG